MDNKEGWKSKEAVEHYTRVANIVIPDRKEILSIIAELATAFAPESLKVLDLGSGSGDVTSEILKRKAHATIYMVDFSEEMIRLSSERFQENGNIRTIQYDLNKGIPTSVTNEEFDTVVSCFAIHHVEFSSRVKLYADVRKILREDGLFINGDRFRGDSPDIDRWEFDNWVAWMVQQIKEKTARDRSFSEVKQIQIDSDKRLGDKPGTIWDMERELKEAGFRYVDCNWKYQNLAILVATK